MQRLFILYDAHCELCRRVRVWLDQQAAFVPLTFLPLQAPDLSERFPGIEALHPDREIVVISDAGEVWQGGAAWVTCLWALREYREWSLRLAHPLLLPLARRACVLISERRHQVSRWLAEESTAGLQRQLAAFPEPNCGPAGCHLPR